MNCGLCPRKCNIDRNNGQVGFCGCTDTVRVGRIAPHYWEEPCICGENGSGAVFFTGCNLRCVYCQNYEISRNANKGRVLTVSELADEYIKLQGQGVSNINLVTPTPWVDKIRMSLDLSWQRGLYLPVVYNCGGYEDVSALKTLRGYISVYLPDFKYCDDGLSKKYSLCPDYYERAIEAIDEMVEQVGPPSFDGDGMLKKGVIVRHLILPGYVEHSKKCLDILHSRYGDDIIISIMNQFTPVTKLPEEINRKLTTEEYAEVCAYAEKIGVELGYTQEEGTVSESFIPKWTEQ